MSGFLGHDMPKNAPNCLLCMTPRAHASGECSARLRAALNQTDEQLALLKSDMLAAPEGACTCIHTHAPTCPAAPRPVDLAAPWVGMRIAVQHEEGDMDGAVTEASPKWVGWRLDGAHSDARLDRATWDQWVQKGWIKASLQWTFGGKP
jgi:hypothetical protein